MKLENITLSEISKIQKDNYCICFHTQEVPRVEIHRDRKQNSGYSGAGRKEHGELLSNGYRVSVWKDEKVPEMDSGDGCTTM